MDISSAMARGNRHQQGADLAVFKFITVSLPKRLLAHGSRIHTWY